MGVSEFPRDLGFNCRRCPCLLKEIGEAGCRMRLLPGGRKLWINSWAGGGGGRGQAVRVWPVEVSEAEREGQVRRTQQNSCGCSPTHAFKPKVFLKLPLG